MLVHPRRPLGHRFPTHFPSRPLGLRTAALGPWDEGRCSSDLVARGRGVSLYLTSPHTSVADWWRWVSQFLRSCAAPYRPTPPSTAPPHQTRPSTAPDLPRSRSSRPCFLFSLLRLELGLGLAGCLLALTGPRTPTPHPRHRTGPVAYQGGGGEV